MASFALRVSLLTISLASAALIGGCDDNPVGNKCFIADAGVDEEITQTQITSPSLDCISRQCLSYPTDVGKALPAGSEETALCTADCSKDSECDGVSVTTCQTGFTCGIVTSVGPFCCQKKCICRDFLNLAEDGQIATPPGCIESDAKNTCCNLPGRGECSGI